jgi:hypothetical protein
LSLVRDNLKQRVDDYNRNVLNLPAMGRFASLSQKDAKGGAKWVQYTLQIRANWQVK